MNPIEQIEHRVTLRVLGAIVRERGGTEAGYLLRSKHLYETAGDCSAAYRRDINRLHQYRATGEL